MNFKRYGRDWNPAARFTMHQSDGFGATGAAVFASRTEARRALRGRSDGYWIKDNINTHFIYEARHGRVIRLRTLYRNAK